MDQVQEVTEELAAAILKSLEYVRYQEARKEIARYPMLKKRADEFRKRNYDLQNSNADIFGEADSLRQEYAYITQNAIVWEYLDAESAFCRVMQRVNWKLMEGLDFELGFEDR